VPAGWALVHGSDVGAAIGPSFGWTLRSGLACQRYAVSICFVASAGSAIFGSNGADRDAGSVRRVSYWCTRT
jgi:hypothetical protein